MDSQDRFQRAKDLFVEVLDLEEGVREAWLQAQCGEDHDLFRDVLELLRARPSMMPEPGGVGDALAAALHGEGPSAQPLKAGDTVGAYTIRKRIGEGGMGLVYLAEQRDALRRVVALKVIKPGMDTRSVLRRFEAERQALAHMSHPGIAKIYEAGSASNGLPYFAMEYIEGTSITQYCDEHRLSTRDRLLLFVRVCDAVQHAHQKGIIHRDLKPSNLLVEMQGGEPVPRVIDFGVAKATAAPLTDGTLFTEVGQLIGTPEYMSPEQAAGSGSTDIDTRSDVYSLGVVLYEFLVGFLPFDSEELHQATAGLQRTIQDVEPEKPSSRVGKLGPLASSSAQQRGTDPGKLVRDLRGDLDWITMKALEKDRDRRYASVSELAADVVRHLAGEPVTAVPPGRAYRLSKFVRRHRGAVSTIGAVFLALTLVTSWALVQRRNADKAREDVLRLSGLKLLQEARNTADELWPVHPKRVIPIERWLTETGYPLRDQLADHEASLRRLRAGSVAGSATKGPWRFRTQEKEWQHGTLTQLVNNLRRFTSPDPAVGTLAQVEQRLERARSIQERSVAGPEVSARWRQAIDAIRSSKAYGSLELEPQIGLVPLRENRQGYWEFLLVETGVAPQPNPDPESLNEWILAEDTGMVLVLIPAGTFVLGAQSHDPEKPHYDPRAVEDEGPVYSVQLDAYFVSKYETTQAQWRRITGLNPGQYNTDWRRPDEPKRQKWWNPVEEVSWNDCMTWLPRFGLELPTEAQWERAARAGTPWPWWCGSKKESIDAAKAANVADRATRESISVNWLTEDWSDPWLVHAPVGSTRANPLGLHDMIGNVAEWCRDEYARDTIVPRPGDGLRSKPGAVVRVHRGGGFNTCADWSRCTFRNNALKPDAKRFTLGVRAVRALEEIP